MAKNLSLEGGREGEKENVKEKWMRRPEWNKIKYRIPRVQLTRHLPEDLFDVCLASPQAMPIFFYIYIYIFCGTYTVTETMVTSRTGTIHTRNNRIIFVFAANDARPL